MTCDAAIIDALGGTSAVARLLKTPISTVHHWRKTRIPPARREHLRLAVIDAGLPLPDALKAAA